ncbi:MAG: SDR family NAD(P)-dependent oxidoreductase [Clostridia bacterium]|nr:SDR family NAD(P)-dependent oxidoreductase [Clostridia bacterium]
MKNIAVITGASSGIGRQFAETIKEGGIFDEVWVIARRIERLDVLAGEMPYPTRAIALDLSEKASYDTYAALLAEENPNVTLLINCSGFGKFCATMDTPVDVNLNMIDLNCEAVVALCQHTIPYMQKGAKIINIASVAAFQPIPYINVYGATKAFVLNFSRALNRELKKNGITVTAVCPFWTKTEFFNRSIDKNKDAVIKKYVAMYMPEQIVARAWKDAKKGKEVSMYGFKAKMQTVLTKILPHRFVMSYWMNQQKLK